jgi:hypothetical protein
VSAAASLSDAQLERFRLFVTGIDALREAPPELLIARGVLPDALAARTFRDDPITRLLDLDAAAQTAFWLLVEELHAGDTAAPL